MIPGARLAAAIEVLDVIETQRRPAADSLKMWGQAHRFAGSKDRAAVATLVYDVLRVRNSAAWIMDDASSRGTTLGMLRVLRGLEPDAIAALASGEGHAPPPLTTQERERLTTGTLEGAPAYIQGDYPEWLAPHLEAAFGDDAAAEGRAFASRAPLDLRVNTLKGDRAKAMRSLAHLNPQEAPLTDTGLRIPLGADGRQPPVSAEPAYLKGLVEVQDEGSQLAARLSGAVAGEQVLDLCAGGGGKSLALATLMGNKGQVYATDENSRRLAPIHDRIARAAARNIQVRSPRGTQDVVADLEGRCDLVLVDAPCSGTGTWRRHPDAKWRMRPGALDERIKDQDEVLRQAVRFVKPGGRLVYITCSVLRAENEERVAALLAEHSALAPIAAGDMATAANLPALAERASRHGAGLRLSPHSTSTDGFYVAGLTRKA